MAKETLYARRRAQGLCGACGKRPPVPGRTLCQEDLDKAAAKSKAKRDSAREYGMCEHGGCCKPALPGRTRCAEHSEYQRKAATETYHTKKAAGICVRTGCHAAAEEHGVMCRKHADESTRDALARYYARKAKPGSCHYCDAPAVGDGTLCEHHREVYAAKRSKLKMEVLAAYGGVCQGCPIGTDPAILEIDHVDGGGCRHRIEINKQGGAQFYQWLKTNNFPPGFRVLCTTCNWKAFKGIPLPNEIAAAQATQTGETHEQQ